MITTILYVLSIIIGFYCWVKAFARIGQDVNILGAILLLVVSILPVVGVVAALLMYSTTCNIPTVNIKFFKGEKK